MIADANKIHDLNKPTEHGKVVLDWLERENSGLIVGGKLGDELGRSTKLMAFLTTLNRAGKKRVHMINDGAVRNRTEALKKSGVCRSNDPHVIALALLTGCRLIFTEDDDLQRDVHNAKILNPTASIYKRKSHKHLLIKCKCKVVAAP